MDKKYDPSNLSIKGYKYDKWYKKDEEKRKTKLEETIAERVKLRKQKADDKDLSDMPPLEVDEDISDIPPLEGDEEEVKHRKGLKFLTPNTLLTSNVIRTNKSWKQFMQIKK